jgi:S1-C subfamily serine protease
LTLTAQASRYYNLPTERGVLVTKVASGSPAEAAGMMEGDIILQVANAQTRTFDDLVAEVHRRRAGDVVRVFALRNGHERYFDLTLSEAS